MDKHGSAACWDREGVVYLPLFADFRGNITVDPTESIELTLHGWFPTNKIKHQVKVRENMRHFYIENDCANERQNFYKYEIQKKIYVKRYDLMCFAEELTTSQFDGVGDKDV
ncbi:hypothetical protein NST74_29465 [Paenibacillus sp. FSL F4-0125]|uniref:hypothetical protein n=1 Tax=Paenibacillus sp. FSL F4-0125 TaxID=2954730 RepID=UPI0030F5095A